MLTVKLKKLFICLATTTYVLMMLGCSKLIVESQPLMVPSNLRIPCPPMKELSDGKASTILRWSNDTAYQYGGCSDKHQSTLLLIDNYNRSLKHGN